MSNLGLDLIGGDGNDEEPTDDAREESGRGGRRRSAPRRRVSVGCIAALVALVLVAVGLWFAVDKGRDWLDGWASDPEDYPGPGSGSVIVQVEEGDTTAAIGRTLKAANVVASVEAFTAAAAGDERSRGIQVGSYELQEEMRAADALAVLIDPDNIARTSITIPEGFRLEQILQRLAAQTDVTMRQLRRAVEAMELPPSADGNPEGYFFPATYDFPPGTTARQMLERMLQRFTDFAAELPLSDAQTVGLSEHDLVTVASIIEKEVNRPEDMPGVAEVIYNRLDGSCVASGVPQGRLQMDSTVHYASGKNDSVFTDDEMRSLESDYNTYQSNGIPPGPIASPGAAALEAALNPTSEGWCYFVAVNLETGETAFAVGQGDHNANVERLRTWCRENPGVC
ncbi:UPF0755 protein [Nocardioides massiliensis]|uniref:Endolytic murein transglycosylase n=2 Tax=Nocardioides massiliensis TaxID=1325935 RepID=A0ABT9NQX9_9ACTN|nr:endolytic transglycosylase MltG [Nocardioides massiliensis]MDP9822834.1 UPF0755 protein [Nocardioides massiliensis]